MFYGWLRRQKAWPLANGDLLVCKYDISHIMWTIRMVTNRRWFIQSMNGQLTKVDKNEVKNLAGGTLPKLHAYRKS